MVSAPQCFGGNNLKVQMIGPGMELHESEVADFIQSKAPLEGGGRRPEESP